MAINVYKLFPADEPPVEEVDVLILYRTSFKGTRWTVAGWFEDEWLAFENPDMPIQGVIGWVHLPDPYGSYE